ncbi:MAG: hypothetical protein ACXVLQ_18325 [Bacteriovorax sp.]
MLEVAMIICLAIMGVYFVKSTDIPKELKDRSAQSRAESDHRVSARPIKMTFPKETVKTPKIENHQESKLAEMKLQKKLKEIQLLNEEIDRLTMAITTLEQEIKSNNERNVEIQATIDSHLANLQLLQEKINALA